MTGTYVVIHGQVRCSRWWHRRRKVRLGRVELISEDPAVIGAQVAHLLRRCADEFVLEAQKNEGDRRG